MHLIVLIFIELFFILFLGLIVYVCKKQKNFFLSYNFNLLILIISISKLFYLLWAYQNYSNMCQLSKHTWC